MLPSDSLGIKSEIKYLNAIYTELISNFYERLALFMGPNNKKSEVKMLPQVL